MSKDQSTREKIYKIIEILGYATIPHLERFFPESKNPKKLLDAQLSRMVKSGILKKRVLEASCKWLNRTIYFIDDPEIHEPKEWQHNFSLKDVEAAFLDRYGFDLGCDVFITERFKLITNDRKNPTDYRPDALIRITAENKTIDYFLELERSRTGTELVRKINKADWFDYNNLIPYKLRNKDKDKLTPLFNIPLNPRTRFFYVLTTRWIDCFERPPFSQKRIDIEKEHLKKVLTAKYISPHAELHTLSEVLTEL